MIIFYFQGNKKNLIFAKTKFHVTEFPEHSSTIWNDFTSTLFKLKPLDFHQANIQLELPILETVSGTSYYRELKQVQFY